MAISVGSSRADRYTLKLLLLQNGAAGAALTLSNAQMLAAMVDGPLKDAWSAVYADDAAAAAALYFGVLAELFPCLVTGIGPWAFTVTVDAIPGHAVLSIASNAAAGSTLLQINYRHSTGR